MATQEDIDKNCTGTFKKGDRVIMQNCMESAKHTDTVWTCRTNSYKDRSGQDVVFLEGYSGCFMCAYLRLESKVKEDDIDWEDYKVNLLESDTEERLEAYTAKGFHSVTGLEYEGIAIFICDELQHVEDINLKS